jgi:two-component system sensor histidine kinase BarA
VIEQYLKEDVDLVLMDIHMPEMDGLEATKQIRLIDAGVKKPPIVALTADVFIKDRDSLAASGLDDYLIKPLTETKLEQMLERFFGGERPAIRGKIADVTEPTIKIELTEELRKRLHEDMRKTLGEVRRYLESNGKDDQFRDAAHTLLGLVGYYEIDEIYEMTKVLDRLIKERKLDDAKQLIVDLGEEMTTYISLHTAGQDRQQ